MSSQHWFVEDIETGIRVASGLTRDRARGMSASSRTPPTFVAGRESTRPAPTVRVADSELVLDLDREIPESLPQEEPTCAQDTVP